MCTREKAETALEEMSAGVGVQIVQSAEYLRYNWLLASELNPRFSIADP